MDRCRDTVLQVGLAILLVAAVCASSGCATLDADAPGVLVPATVANDPTLPHITVNGTRLHAETFGSPENPTLVFLHGGPGGSGYRSMLRLAALQDDYYLVFWDQRGSGLSERHPPGVYTMETMLDDLEAVIDHYSGDDGVPVVLIGHSWGGQFAAAYISHAPERVLGAVLLDPGPFTRALLDLIGYYDLDVRHAWFNDWLWNNDFMAPDSHARADFIRTFDGGSEGELNRGYHVDTTDPARGWRLGAAAATSLMASEPDFDFTTGLAAFEREVLFIRGGLNEIHSAGYMARQMAFFSNARLVTIPGVGHDLQWAAHERVVDEIRAYLEDLP